MNERLVLCYHGLSDSWPADLALPASEFERQILMLRERGYAGATFRDLVAGDCPRKAVAVTFDDAWRSVLERGFPILSRLGLPATVFVPTDFPDRGGTMSWPGVDGWVGGPHEREMRCLTWSELRGLAGEGWEIGSHSCSHPHLTTLDDAELRRQLVASREACEREIGAPCTSFAYPYGDCDERVMAATGAAGYARAGALESRLAGGEPLRWPRIGVYRADRGRRYAVKLSRPMRLMRASPAWDAVAGARVLASGALGRLRRGAVAEPGPPPP